MSRPWLLQLGPFYVPTEGREELMELHERVSSEQYADKIWKLRYPHGNPARQSKADIWPLQFGSKNTVKVSNVVEMKRP